MKKILSSTALVIVALAIFTACQNAASSSSPNVAKTPEANAPKTEAPKTDSHGHSDDAPRISLADAKKDFDAGNAIFIDTRGEASYKNEHVKGAINITMDSVETRYKEIPTGKKIIAYCS